MIVNWCKTKNFTKQESILLADPKLKTCSNWWVTWEVKTNNYSKVLIINVEKYLQPQNGLLLISKLIKYRVECSFFCCTSTYSRPYVCLSPMFNYSPIVNNNKIGYQNWYQVNYILKTLQ